MRVEIENKYLEHAINLLQDIDLTQKRSRHRTKFVKLLRQGLEEYIEDFRELLKEHCHLDEDGNPKTITKNGQQYWDTKDSSAFDKDKKELDKELYVIDGGNNEKVITTVKKVLEQSNKEYKGLEADIYDYLCDQFGVDD